MCRTQENISLNRKISSGPRTGYPPSDLVKSCCVASGRKRHSSVRRNLCPREGIFWQTESMLNQPPMAPAEVHHFENPKEACESMTSCVTSPLILNLQKKVRAVLDVKRICEPDRTTHTADAIALCRGDLKGASIWDYFQSNPMETSLKPRRPLSARRSSNSSRKSMCVAGGRCRPSAVVRTSRLCNVHHVDDDDSSDNSPPQSPLTDDSSAWKIAEVAATSEKQNVQQPLINSGM